MTTRSTAGSAGIPRRIGFITLTAPISEQGQTIEHSAKPVRFGSNTGSRCHECPKLGALGRLWYFRGKTTGTGDLLAPIYDSPFYSAVL